MKYEVTYYYHTSCKVLVEADSEEEAIEYGRMEDSSVELLDNLEEDNAPDAIQID